MLLFKLQWLAALVLGFVTVVQYILQRFAANCKFGFLLALSKAFCIFGQRPSPLLVQTFRSCGCFVLTSQQKRTRLFKYPLTVLHTKIQKQAFSAVVESAISARHVNKQQKGGKGRRSKTSTKGW